MKVLVVCSLNAGLIAPFISEQVNSIRKSGITFEYFLITGKGMTGYLSNLHSLRKKCFFFKPDLIHAHYGFSGLFANLQREIPVITTFHGSDVNIKWVRPFSFIAALLSKHNIFVSERIARKLLCKGKFSIIPSGTDLEIFHPVNKNKARKLLNLPQNETLILFSGASDNPVKNYPLAKAAVDLLEGVKLIDLKGYTRQEVNLLINACDAALMTSFCEGSPQFIKEAMACSKPVVSTDVGDVKKILGTTPGCYTTRPIKSEIADQLKLALNFKYSTKGRQRIINLGLDLETISGKILKIYNEISNE